MGITQINPGDVFERTAPLDPTDGVGALAEENGMTGARVDEIETDGRVRFHFENLQTGERLNLPISNSREGFLSHYSKVLESA